MLWISLLWDIMVCFPCSSTWVSQMDVLPSHFSRIWTVSPTSRAKPWVTEPRKLQITEEKDTKRKRNVNVWNCFLQKRATQQVTRDRARTFQHSFKKINRNVIVRMRPKTSTVTAAWCQHQSSTEHCHTPRCTRQCWRWYSSWLHQCRQQQSSELPHFTAALTVFHICRAEVSNITTQPKHLSHPSLLFSVHFYTPFTNCSLMLPSGPVGFFILVVLNMMWCMEVNMNTNCNEKWNILFLTTPQVNIMRKLNHIRFNTDSIGLIHMLYIC